MANSYHVGDAVRIFTETVFSDLTPAAFDPDVVRGKVRDPAGNVTVYVYGKDPQMVRNGTGDYQFDVEVDQAGTWYYRIEGETAGEAYRGADEGTFEAQPTQF